ncbi:MAG: hypothetical protein GC159_19255 [Phycisphaera sp.]|nr:hypothetical protein [Phycisphaera sp.]
MNDEDHIEDDTPPLDLSEDVCDADELGHAEDAGGFDLAAGDIDEDDSLPTTPPVARIAAPALTPFVKGLAISSIVCGAVMIITQGTLIMIGLSLARQHEPRDSFKWQVIGVMMMLVWAMHFVGLYSGVSALKKSHRQPNLALAGIGVNVFGLLISFGRLMLGV